MRVQLTTVHVGREVDGVPNEPAHGLSWEGVPVTTAGKIGDAPRCFVRRGMCPQLTLTGPEFSIEIEGIANKNAHQFPWIAVACTVLAKVSNLPCRTVRSVVRPKFLTRGAVVGIEIDGVTNEDVHLKTRKAGLGSALDVGHLPRCLIGSVVSPQLIPGASVPGVEIEGVTHQYLCLHVSAGEAVARTVVDVRHPPSRTVGRVVGPQFDTVGRLCGEVESIADKERPKVVSWSAGRCIGEDVCNLPCGSVGGAVGPQFLSCATVIGIKIDGVAHKHAHGITWVGSRHTAVDVVDEPG